MKWLALLLPAALAWWAWRQLQQEDALPLTRERRQMLVRYERGSDV